MKISTIAGPEYEVHSDSMAGACVPLGTFEYLNQLGEGRKCDALVHKLTASAYGVVYRARDKRDDSIVALKTVRIFESDKGEGIPITALREISILRSLRHTNVVNVLEVAVGEALDEIFMVEEYAEQDLANILDTVRVKFTPSEVHKQGIIHRDLKMSNLLLTRRGVLKIADFGMARDRAGWMTPQPVTIWYRCPELLFGAQSYSYPVDMWSCGCIIAELITSQPLLPGSNEKEEMDLIVDLLGPPSETTWPGYKRLPWAGKYNAPTPLKRREGLRSMFQAEKPGLIDLLSELLRYCPEKRITAKESLHHKYFRESPAPQDPSLLPTFPELRNETDSRKSRSLPVVDHRRDGLIFDEGDLRSQYGVSGKKRRVEEI